MAGTNIESALTSTLKIREIDSNGLILSATCTGAPPTTASIFQHGAICVRTDSGTGTKAIYENTGSTASPAWNLIGDVTAGEIALAEGSVLVGNNAGVATALSAKTTTAILIGNGTTITSAALSGDATMTNGGVVSVSDLTIASEARGDIVRRGATAWERHSAKDSGKILVGDGTDVKSVAVSGDATLAADGTLTVTSAFSSVIYTLTAANIAAMYAAPVVVVAGQAGKVIEFCGATVVYDYATDTYGAGGACVFQEETSTTAVSTTFAAADSFGAAGDKLIVCNALAAASRVPTAGKGLCLTNDSGAFTNPGTAAGVGRLHIKYRVITTNL